MKTLKTLKTLHHLESTMFCDYFDNDCKKIQEPFHNIHEIRFTFKHEVFGS